jgi:hypothetical protein
MKRSLLPLVVVPAIVAGAAGTSLSGAAFVDTADSPTTTAAADSIERWLELVRPAPGTACAPVAGFTVEDAGASLALEGAAATPRSLPCAFMVRARQDLPGGLENVTVSAAVEGALLANPLLGGARSAQIAAGEARPLSLGVAPGATGRVVLTVTPPGEEPRFQRYEVPVQLAAQPGGGTTPIPTPTTPTPPTGDESPTTTATEPSTAPPAPTGSDPLVQPPAVEEAQPSKRCSTRRSYSVTVRWPKRAGLRKVRVTVAGKRVRLVRRGGRLLTKVNLRRRTTGKLRVVLTARTKSGKRVRYVRTYRTCARGTASGS